MEKIQQALERAKLQRESGSNKVSASQQITEDAQSIEYTKNENF